MNDWEHAFAAAYGKVIKGYTDDQCPRCGRVIQIGDFPFCDGQPEDHARESTAIATDDVPGGFVVENGFPEPTRFYSHSAHEKALAERGLEVRAKWAGETDKHLKRWDAPTAKTLDDARVLLSRGTQARIDRRAELEAAKAEFPVTVTTIPWSETS